MPTEHETIKASINESRRETHARVDRDVEKLKNHPGYDSLPSMVKCYIDILVLDIDLLKQRELHAQTHIDRLDAMLDSFMVTT